MLQQDYLLFSFIHAYSLLYEQLGWRFPLGLGAQCVDSWHPLFEAMQEVFRQAVPVTGQTLPVLQNSLHAEPGECDNKQTGVENHFLKLIKINP